VTICRPAAAGLAPPCWGLVTGVLRCLGAPPVATDAFTAGPAAAGLGVDCTAAGLGLEVPGLGLAPAAGCCSLGLAVSLGLPAGLGFCAGLGLAAGLGAAALLAGLGLAPAGLGLAGTLGLEAGFGLGAGVSCLVALVPCCSNSWVMLYMPCGRLLACLVPSQ
jgi:hypothetical protein